MLSRCMSRLSGRVLIRNVDDAVLAALRARATAGHTRADLAAEFAEVRAMTPKGRRRLAENLVREGRDER